MSLLRNRYLWLIASVAALVYASKYYTIGGLEHLRIVSHDTLQGSSPTETNLRDHRTWEPSRAGDLTFDDDRPVAGSRSTAAASPSGLGAPRTTPSGMANAPTRWVSSPSMSGSIVPPKSTKPTLRIASFNLQAFGETKASKVAVMEILARILRHFDVIALQDITARQRDTLPSLVDRINQTDRHYDYCIGPRVGKGLNATHFAFVFDTDRVEVDRYQLYTVDDPMDQLEFEPLVGWFRSRLVSDDAAFTFSLVNLRISPQNAEREVKLLPELFRTILQDGRKEDDVLLAGDFGCADARMESLKRLGMSFALEGVSTTIAGDEMLDNIIFPSQATDEFMGRSGTVDFLRQFNLTPDQAFQVSNHMPVWCEFSAQEGGQPGYVPSK